MPAVTVQSLNNLAELRTIAPATPSLAGEIYYVKNHSNAGDGGGGFFMWMINSIFFPPSSEYFTMDNNGTLVRSDAEDDGMWVRQYTGYINILFFGATLTTAQVAIQDAIKFAWNNQRDVAPTIGTTVFIPEGSWIIDHIELYNGVELVGDSQDKTIISPLSADKGGTSAPMFTIPIGSVKIAISNLVILGDREVESPDTIPDKIGFHFTAAIDGTDGGLWQSSFKRIEIIKFKNHCIWLEGINEYVLNQFLYFEQVYTTLNILAETSVCALKITGQTGQQTFVNCGFNGYKNDGVYHTGNVISISHRDEHLENYVAVASFINCTIQEGDYGVYIDYAESITFDTCWFESLGVAITVYGEHNECRNINILNNRFANAAGYGSLDVDSPNITAGVIVNIINSLVTVANNFVTVSDPNSDRLADDYFVVTTPPTSGINPGVTLFGNGFATQILSRTDTMQVVVVTGSTIVTRGNTIVYVNTSVNTIDTIESTLGAGETIHIRANSGAITFDNTGNIFLTLRSSLTLQNGEIASFTRIGPTDFQLTSLVTATTP